MTKLTRATTVSTLLQVYGDFPEVCSIAYAGMQFDSGYSQQGQRLGRGKERLATNTMPLVKQHRLGAVGNSSCHMSHHACRMTRNTVDDQGVIQACTINRWNHTLRPHGYFLHAG